jgi:hypothetical protein
MSSFNKVTSANIPLSGVFINVYQGGDCNSCSGSISLGHFTTDSTGLYNISFMLEKNTCWHLSATKDG